MAFQGPNSNKKFTSNSSTYNKSAATAGKNDGKKLETTHYMKRALGDKQTEFVNGVYINKNDFGLVVYIPEGSLAAGRYFISEKRQTSSDNE